MSDSKQTQAEVQVEAIPGAAPGKALPPAARRALEEAAARRAAIADPGQAPPCRRKRAVATAPSPPALATGKRRAWPSTSDGAALESRLPQADDHHYAEFTPHRR
jgi:hypothetical protein